MAPLAIWLLADHAETVNLGYQGNAGGHGNVGVNTTSLFIGFLVQLLTEFLVDSLCCGVEVAGDVPIMTVSNELNLFGSVNNDENNDEKEKNSGIHNGNSTEEQKNFNKKPHYAQQTTAQQTTAQQRTTAQQKLKNFFFRLGLIIFPCLMLLQAWWYGFVPDVARFCEVTFRSEGGKEKQMIEVWRICERECLDGLNYSVYEAVCEQGM